MLKEVYQLIQQRIQTEVAEFKEVEWFLNQYAETEDQDAWYATPSAYIEFLPITYSSHGGLQQRATVVFRIHVASEALFGDGRRITDSAINHISLVDRVYVALHGWNAKLSDLSTHVGNDAVFINTVSRTELAPDHGHFNTMVTIQTFQFAFIDNSAVAQMQTVTNPTLLAHVTTN